MKPQPMSDAEIIEVRKSLGRYQVSTQQWGDTLALSRAIIAARDAQWAAMIGEPVAWRLSGAFHEGPDGPKYWTRSPTPEELALWESFGHPATVSPLYAIKEAP